MHFMAGHQFKPVFEQSENLNGFNLVSKFIPSFQARFQFEGFLFFRLAVMGGEVTFSGSFFLKLSFSWFLNALSGSLSASGKCK